MRRAVALLVSVVFGLLTIAPLLAANAEPDVPACCRRDGKHHCAMAGMARTGTNGPAFQARCPYPSQIGVRGYTPVSSTPAVSQSIERTELPAIRLAEKSQPLANRPARGASLKRGPPSFPA